MSILTGNDYNRGFKKGREDALQDNDKWNLKAGFEMGFSLKHAIHGKYALDTFTKGYNAGYESGLKEKHTINKTVDYTETNKFNTNNNLKHKTMARQTSFAHQLELMEALKSYLNGFQERLGAVAQNYESRVSELYDAGGMMDETYEDFYNNYLEVTKSKIQNLINQINEEDIPFVEKQIDYLESRPSS